MMRLISILFYIVLATTNVDANVKDLVKTIKDTIKTDVSKIILQPKTKIIALDSNIVPTWNDVVPKRKYKKITLKTVLNRWNKMEKKTRDAYAALVSSPMDKLQAIAKVTKFYDDSEKCLKQQGKVTRKVNEKTFSMIMKAVRKCIDDTNTPPTFEVDVNATVPVLVDDDEENDLDTGDSTNTGGDGDDTTSDSGSGSSSGSSSGSGSAAVTPTIMPTLAPTEAPTKAPTQAPTEAPTEPPTEAPTEKPTEAPTAAPTEAPTDAPTEAATEAPTEAPAEEPTEAATEAPTVAPTDAPTEAPADEPTKSRTEEPTEAPTEEPTEAPAVEPTEAPTEEPTEAPAEESTESPTEEPTEAPTEEPTEAPTDAPTEAPAEEPTKSPTEEPTEAPTEEPTEAPAEPPTEAPTEEPTETATETPTEAPTEAQKDDVSSDGSQSLDDSNSAPEENTTESNPDIWQSISDNDLKSNDDNGTSTKSENSNTEVPKDDISDDVWQTITDKDEDNVDNSAVTDDANGDNYPESNAATPEESNSGSLPGFNVESTEGSNSDNDALTASAVDSNADNNDNSEPNVDDALSTNAYESNPVVDHPLSEDAGKSSIGESSFNDSIVKDEAQLQPSSTDDQVTYIPYVYKPSLAQVAPFSALDVNGDGQVTSDEWKIYVKGLHDAAYSRVEKGKDDRAKRMIKNVIEFHYSILGGCITNNVGTQSLKDDAKFQAVVNTIESNCYVKFRYSLLSGPPPFEWVAKRNATVTPAQMEEWFNKAVKKAKADIKNKRIVNFTRAEQEQVEHVMDCIYKILGTFTASALNRDIYYTKLDQVGKCVGSFTN